jgi:hypothetical protein
MFRSAEEDDYYLDYEEYLDLEGGDDDGKKPAATPEAKTDAKEAEPAKEEGPKFDANGNQLDKNGLIRHATGYIRETPKKDNPCLGCFKKVFSKMYPYNSVETFTGWGKVLKYYLFAATILHTLFIAISLALTGFEPMFYNMLLALLAYSCYLTLNNCTICSYVTLLVFAIAGGLTWGIAYTGTATTHLHCKDSKAAAKGASTTSSIELTESSGAGKDCTSTSTSGGGLNGEQSISLFCCIGMYCILLVLVGRALWFFRKTGGIRGLNKRDGLIEDKLLGGAKMVAGAVASKTNDAIDKDNKESAKQEYD